MESALQGFIILSSFFGILGVLGLLRVDVMYYYYHSPINYSSMH